MALKIFISYSTKDLQVVNFVQSMLVGSPVEVFIAKYSVLAGQHLAQSIIAAIKQCDLFVLLWSKNSEQSDWVPQEIGIAKAENKQIIPIVLHPGLKLPGFISDLKYLDVPKDPQGTFTWLRDNVFAQANEKQKQEAIAWLAIGGALLWLLSRK